MRKLTVKRKFSIVECATRTKLYVQTDKRANTVVFDGLHFFEYRLKNGKTVELDIPSEKTVVVLVKTSIQTLRFEAREGEGDIGLIVRAHYYPAKQNPFTLDPITQ